MRFLKQSILVCALFFVACGTPSSTDDDFDITDGSGNAKTISGPAKIPPLPAAGTNLRLPRNLTKEQLETLLRPFPELKRKKDE
jgi:hypothetical protein